MKGKAEGAWHFFDEHMSVELAPLPEMFCKLIYIFLVNILFNKYIIITIIFGPFGSSP